MIVFASIFCNFKKWQQAQNPAECSVWLYLAYVIQACTEAHSKDVSLNYCNSAVFISALHTGKTA